MKYLLATIFVIYFISASSGQCPSAMWSADGYSSPYIASGQTQTFKATATGPLNAIELQIQASSTVSLSVTLETLGGGSTLGVSTTSVTSGDSPVFFVFSTLPSVTVNTYYQFTVSYSADVLVAPAYGNYADGELSGGGDYYFFIEVLCETPSTCPATIAPVRSGYPITEGYEMPSDYAGTLTNLYLEFSPSFFKKEIKRSSATVLLLDDSDNQIGSSTVSIDFGAIAFPFLNDLTAATTYKFKIVKVPGWDVSGTQFPYQFGSLDVYPDKDVYFYYDLICTTGGSGDPHFFGFLNQKYDVMGQSHEIYNIISMSDFQVNARFIPYYKTAYQTEPTGTMIGELGIKLGTTKIYINPNDTDSLINQTPVSLETSWTLDISPGVSVHNEFSHKSYRFTINTPILSLTFIRKVYSVSQLEPQYHFDYKAKLYTSDADIHGLLGQSYKEKYFPEKTGAFKYLDGVEDDYRIKTNKLFDDTFKFNKFVNM